MITRVKDLIAELQRFNPDAIFPVSIQVSSISPSTSCNLSFDGCSMVEAAYLKEKNGDLDTRCNELIDLVEKLAAQNKKYLNAAEESFKVVDALITKVL